MGNPKGILGGPDSHPCRSVVVLSHRLRLAIATSYRLVNDFQHPNIAILLVGAIVDNLRYPLEEFVGALVLIVDIEARRGSILFSSCKHDNLKEEDLSALPGQYRDSSLLALQVRRANR